MNEKIQNPSDHVPPGTPTLEGSMTPGSELGEKRFYLPGIKLKAKCPRCSAPWVRDMGDNYLSYPKVGTPIVCSGYGGECEHKWEYQLRIVVSLEVI